MSAKDIIIDKIDIITWYNNIYFNKDFLEHGHSYWLFKIKVIFFYINS